MKATIKVEKEVDIKFIQINVAVRYGEEDIPKDFPMRTGDMWNAIIDIDEHRIIDWPIGDAGELYMKICDQGSYYLLDADKNVLASIEDDYVPNSFLPGSYGDYLSLKINSNGIVTNWKTNPSLEEFFPEVN